jgi:hypothetical protein
MSLTPGAQCGAYEIAGLLGTGGMAEVFIHDKYEEYRRSNPAVGLSV